MQKPKIYAVSNDMLRKINATQWAKGCFNLDDHFINNLHGLTNYPASITDDLNENYATILYLLDHQTIDSDYSDQIIFIPFIEGIVSAYVKNGFEVTGIIRSLDAKVDYFFRKQHIIMNKYDDHVFQCLTDWEKDHVQYDEIIKKYNLPKLEIKIGEELSDYFLDTKVLLSQPKPRSVCVTMQDYYKRFRSSVNTFPDDNIKEWISFFQKVLDEVPEEFQDVANWEFDESHELGFVTYLRPETKEERIKRIEQYNEQLNNFRLLLLTINLLFNTNNDNQ